MAAKIQTPMRLCRRCSRETALSKRSHAVYCTELCGTLYRNKRWQAANPDKMKRAIKRWGDRNRARVLENNRRWRHKDLAKHAQRAKDWRKAHPEKWNALVMARYAAKTRAIPVWLERADKLEIEDTYRRAREVTATTGRRWHVDHIIPLRGKEVCGLHVPWNLQVLSAEENVRKRNHHVC